MSEERTFIVNAGKIGKPMGDNDTLNQIDSAFKDLERLAAKATKAAQGPIDTKLKVAKAEVEKLRERQAELMKKTGRAKAEQDAIQEYNKYGFAVVQDPRTGERGMRETTIEDIERMNPDLAKELRSKGIKAGSSRVPGEDLRLNPADFGLTEADLQRAKRLPEGEDDEHD